jgi:hypothetical protein
VGKGGEESRRVGGRRKEGGEGWVFVLAGVRWNGVCGVSVVDHRILKK